MGGYLDYLVCGRNPWFGAGFTLCSDTRIIIIIIIIIITIITIITTIVIIIIIKEAW